MLASTTGGKTQSLAGEPPPTRLNRGEASCSEESCPKNGFSVSWKLASVSIHDYVNFENRLSRKPASQWIEDFIFHTFYLQHTSVRARQSVQCNRSSYLKISSSSKIPSRKSTRQRFTISALAQRA